MIYVIFEVIINKNKMDEYLNLASELKNELSLCDGFVRSERFSSILDERKLLSLSVWESEESINNWINKLKHRLSQKQGRDSVFENYSLTVASQIRNYTNIDRREAPIDSNKFFNI